MSSHAKFAIGDRVRVLENHHWARGALGSITRPAREVATVAGSGFFFWVDFDVSQMDADGDGPYFGGEIISTALEVA
jgi:hypothetical protein